MGNVFFGGGGGGGGQQLALNEGGLVARGQAVPKTRASFLMEGLLAGFVGDPRSLRSALASNRTHRRRLVLLSRGGASDGGASDGGASTTAMATSEDLRGAYDDGVLVRRVLDWAMFFFANGGGGGGSASSSTSQASDGFVSTILQLCGPSALAVATELAAFALPPPPPPPPPPTTTTTGKSTATTAGVAGGGGGGGFSTLSFKVRK